MTDLIAKVDAMRQKAQDRAEENRRRMPTVAEWVAEAKQAFGADQVRVCYAHENGITLGELGPDGVKISDTIVGPWNRRK